ncbi:MAG: hypothetical protein JKY34_08640 [Kordiimonadaceae bacterium]|nr:hypothetical protein [Kordiimonadaceae bacterium]
MIAAEHVVWRRSKGFTLQDVVFEALLAAEMVDIKINIFHVTDWNAAVAVLSMAHAKSEGQSYERDSGSRNITATR